MLRYRKPPPEDFVAYNSFTDFIQFQEWVEEREAKKKASDKKPDKPKGIFGEAKPREIFWWMFFLSPMVGIPVAYTYLVLIKQMWVMLQALAPTTGLK